MQVLLLLGSVPFLAGRGPGFSKLKRESVYRWASQNRIGRPPAKQFMGPGGDTITLKGVMTSRLGPVQSLLPQLRAMADRGRPEMLTSGDGEVLGMYCVTRIGGEGEHFLGGGSAQKIEFEIEVKAFGPDDEGLPNLVF